MKGVVSSMTLTALSLGAMIGAVRAPAGTVEIDTSTIGEPISGVSPLSCGSGSGHVHSGGGYSEGFEEFGVFVHFFSQ